MTSAGVFVLGCPRSGTSAMAHALAAHDDFWTSAESHFVHLLLGPRGRLREVYDQVATGHGGRRRWLTRNEVDFDEFCRAIGSGIDDLFAGRAGGRRWVDQTPAHALMIEDLGRLFPDARFVHVVRDGPEVVRSMLASGFGARWASDFGEACRTWATFVERALDAEAAMPERVVRVRNADMRHAPSVVERQVLGFLGSTLDGSVASRLASERTNSSFDRHPDTPPTDGWSQEQRETFEAIAGAMQRQISQSISPRSGRT